MPQIYPSLLAADQNKLETILKQLDPLVPGFHIDIIDNKFAPNQGLSIETTNTISRLSIKQLWVHIMAQEPESYLEQLAIRADSIVTFHLESHKHASHMIEKIQAKGWLPGIALKPKTGIDEIFPYLSNLYQVLIMSVEPGFSGQAFLPETLAKVDPLVGERNTGSLSFKIAMDGGIGMKNIVEITAKGVDQLAVGSEIFKHPAGIIDAYKLLTTKVG